MNIFNVLNLIGGLALFLFGMDTMGDGLVQASGGKLEKILAKLTTNKLVALLTGAAVTAVIQSSSATTVMVVGFVNSGIMKLQQAVGVIMGANIGTTVTSWILSLTGIQGTNIFVKLCKPSSFSPILAAIGIILLMTAKEESKKKDIGRILLGFAVLMFGMETMSSATSPLADSPAFTSLFTKFSQPILGMAAGAILTAIIQSSSASVGILQALCATGAVGYGAALPIIMGQNIGTCVTALISSVGANKNAKRTAMMHMYFNLIGTIIFMVVFYSLNSVIHFEFLDRSASVVGIAVIHSLFNIGCAVCWFPFSNFLVKLAEWTVKDKEEVQETDVRLLSLARLDERFLDQPSFAMQLCRDTVDEMAERARDAFVMAMDILGEYSQEQVDEIIRLEQDVDRFEDALGSYLVKLSSRNLGRKDSRDLSILLHSINDFERISDHAVNIVECAQGLSDRSLKLTDKGQMELSVFSNAIRDILNMTVDVFENEDIDRARDVEALEEVVDDLSLELKKRHVRRLREGSCSMEAGLFLEDILIYYERVSDHCSNVAISLIELGEDEFEMHEVANNKVKSSEWFESECARMAKRYVLP